LGLLKQYVVVLPSITKWELSVKDFPKIDVAGLTQNAVVFQENSRAGERFEKRLF
jgi:hypothetical protein